MDTAFVAEVKRIARARGLSAHALAYTIGAHQSEVTRHLKSGARRTLAKTAEQYATALGIDPAYLRLCAAGKIAPGDVSMSMQTLRALFDAARPSLDGLYFRQLWDLTVEAIKADQERALRALAIPSKNAMRELVNVSCDIYERPTEPFDVLKETLALLGIDLLPYLIETEKKILNDLWLMLCSTLPDDDCAEIIDLVRRRLKGRGRYDPDMDAWLESCSRARMMP